MNRTLMTLPELVEAKHYAEYQLINSKPKSPGFAVSWLIYEQVDAALRERAKDSRPRGYRWDPNRAEDREMAADYGCDLRRHGGTADLTRRIAATLKPKAYVNDIPF